MCKSSATGRDNDSLYEPREQCRRRVRLVLVLAALSCMLPACTTRTTEREILPWFKERTAFFKFGSFAETPEDRTYRAQHVGFLWLPVSASGAVALSDAVVLLDRGTKGKAVLTRGALTANPVCPMTGEVSVPPSTSTVECLQVLSDPKTFGIPGFHGLIVKRTGFNGETVYEKTIEVPDASHAFEKIGFYDGGGTAYFLAVSSEFLKNKREPPDCVLLQGFGQDTRIVARRPDVTDVTKCYRAETWAQQTGPIVARWDTIKYPGSHNDPRRPR